jgi:anti-sigma regulatory factor (Ser/Thr protein kinase)
MAPIQYNDAVVAVVWVPPLTGTSASPKPSACRSRLAFFLADCRHVGRGARHLQAGAGTRPQRGTGWRIDLTARAPAIGGDKWRRRRCVISWPPISRRVGRNSSKPSRPSPVALPTCRTSDDAHGDSRHAETLALPQFPTTKEGLRAVKVIQEEGERIERLVKDLLDLARFEAGGISLEQDNVDIDEIFERVSERHAKTAQEKSVEIVIDPHEDDIRMVGDPMRLEQAVQNLAANALRHTPPGGKIRLGASREGGRIKLTVTDNGAGIAPEHLPHVFDRFYKADQSRLHAGGSGLGLSIVKAIVERHGGTVAARSDQGVATVFEIVLPERRSSIEKMP